MKISSVLYAAGFVSILISAMNFLSGKTQAGAEHERNALFVGEWPPTFFILGKIMEDRETRGEAQPLHL